MSLTSIIIPTHNRPHLLTRAVDSALAAGTNTEVIVVDDASTDETASVCSALHSIKYVRVEPNQGVAGARNAGLSASCGEYVTFLDDDDLRLPNSLNEQVALLAACKEAGLIYGQATVGDQACRPTNEKYPLACPQGDVFWDLLGKNFLPCGSVVFRRSCLDAVGRLDYGLPGLDDWDFWIRIAELYPVIALEKPVMIWRRSTPVSGQGTSQAANLALKGVRQFRERWMMLPRAAEAQAKMRQQAWQDFSDNLGRHLLLEARRASQYGNKTQASRNVLTALHLFPFAIVRLARRRRVSDLLRAIRRRARRTLSNSSHRQGGRQAA